LGEASDESLPSLSNMKITDLLKEQKLVALKVFKPGDEFRQLADVEYQLLKKLENTTQPGNLGIERGIAPVIKAHSFTGSDQDVTLAASEVLSGNGSQASLSPRAAN